MWPLCDCDTCRPATRAGAPAPPAPRSPPCASPADLVTEVNGPDGGAAAAADGAEGGAGGAGRSRKKRPRANAVKLNNNEFTSMKGLDLALAEVVHDPAEVAWVDLSFNQLDRIDRVYAEFPGLQRLYLHANNITNLTDVDRLQELTQLRSLTLHGNPIQENKLYRNYIISQIPWLRTLDFSAITRKDLDVAITWRKMTTIKKKRKAKPAEAAAEAS